MTEIRHFLGGFAILFTIILLILMFWLGAPWTLATMISFSIVVQYYVPVYVMVYAVRYLKSFVGKKTDE